MSNERSVRVVVKHHASICMALEHIYVEAGDHCSDAGGLLLLLRKKSTAFILSLLSRLLTPLANLSKSLQSSKGNITEALSLVRLVKASIQDMKMEELLHETRELCSKAMEHNVHMEEDDGLTEKDLMRLAASYRDKIVDNMNQRFSDQFQELVKLHDIFLHKIENPDLRLIADMCAVNGDDMQREYSIYRRYPGNIETQDSLLMLACGEERKSMFPTLSQAATRILLLPVGTAGVERTFSTMNRILCSERSRLLPDHVDSLMKISIEGPQIPCIKNRTSNSEEISESDENYKQCIDSAYSIWLTKPRRNV